MKRKGRGRTANRANEYLARLLKAENQKPKVRVAEAISPRKAGSARAHSSEPFDTVPSGSLADSLGREYKPGSGWQSLMLAGILIALCGVVAIPRKTLDRWLHGPPPVQIVAPDVLLASSSSQTRNTVAETVHSRHGYSLRTTTSAQSAIKSLQQDSERIGFVVIDSDMANARQVAAAARAACPNAQIITLAGARDPARIASALIGAGMK